ncbi:MAG TPA: diphosphomevalonate decarboxylase [archaeon]|nr:diphosphomevalonate decarboxylase [archaeon]
MSKATATAHSNIALVKYWGKRNSELMLPQNGSISMTVSDLNVNTTVEFGSFPEDSLVINNQKLNKGTEEYDDYVGIFLNVVRNIVKKDLKAKIVSESNFPIAAGLASSAAGFAALALATSKALDLPTDEKSVSILARRGSGSASRSISGGFVEWKRGEKEDGTDSVAVQIAPKDHWSEFRMLTTIVTSSAKKVKSRAGMAQTLKTCPYYKGWLESVNQDLDIVRKGILEKDFTSVGQTSEFNALKMHATMMTTKPPIIYWMPSTLEIMQSVMAWREEGLESYFTMDAGPQVKVMCLQKDVLELKKRVSELSGVQQVIECKPGDGARLLDKHLF